MNPPARPRPSLEDGEQMWRVCAATGGPLRLEDAYATVAAERHFDTHDALAIHLEALIGAGRHADVADLCTAVLASGAEFPRHWHHPRVTALLALGRLADATAAMPALVATSDDYAEAVVAAMRYHHAIGEPDVGAMLDHAGTQWISTFKYCVTEAEARRRGKAPADLRARFAAWIIRWCEGVLANPIEILELGHWTAWFKRLGARHFGELPAAFDHEWSRRSRLREALETAPDETSASVLLEQLVRSITSEHAFEVHEKLHARAPLASFRLLRAGISNERRNGFRYFRGERVDAVSALMQLALEHRELGCEVAMGYEIGRGYVRVPNPILHATLARCAARLGHVAAARDHVARALALDHPAPEQLRDAQELTPLQAEVAAMVAEDHARRLARDLPSKKPMPGRKITKKSTKKKPSRRERKRT